jgi:hypothetical protein
MKSKWYEHLKQTHTHAVTNSWLDSRQECVRYWNAGRLLLADCSRVAALGRLPYRQAQPRLCTTPPSLIHPLIPSGSQPRWEWQLNHRHHSKYLTPTWRTVLFLSLELLLSSIYCPLTTLKVQTCTDTGWSSNKKYTSTKRKAKSGVRRKSI